MFKFQTVSRMAVFFIAMALACHAAAAEKATPSAKVSMRKHFHRCRHWRDLG